ncbi:MAG: hypothetical protein HY272_03170 [Gammaproteobacteria bacterium]|nr:hypothetical protein [Gammaproteobacteria bacterium]
MTLRALRINYATDAMQPTQVGMLTLAIGAIFALSVSIYLVHLSREVTSWEARLESASYRKDSLANTKHLDPAQEKQLAHELGRANEMVAQLSMPWNDIFSAIESAQTKSMALLSVEPDSDKGSVLITAEAATLNDVLHYARRLKNTELFTDAYLTDHTIVTAHPERPVRFSVATTWAQKK